MPNQQAMVSRAQNLELMLNSALVEEQRKEVRKGFENVKRTKEYVERTYYNRALRDDRDLVGVNEYWVDLARHLVTRRTAAGFLSENFIYALSCHAEMILALAFLDLPFEGNRFDQRKRENRKLEISSTHGSLLIFSRQMNQTTMNARQDILVTQRLFDPDDRYLTRSDGKRVEKRVEQIVKQ